MRRRASPIGFCALGLLAGMATAQAAVETWVAEAGSDAGLCPLTAPCRTFAFAHGKTSSNGTINVLSSGNFGPLNITKPISIVAQGVEAVINASGSTAAIMVQAGTGTVSLRGLTIDMRGADKIGILFFSGAALHVHDTAIRRTSNGIKFAPASGSPELYVADSVVADTTGFGIFVSPAGGTDVKATFDRVRVENGAGTGFEFQAANTASIAATVRDSVAAGNSGGIRAFDTGSSDGITVMVDRTAVVNNEFRGIAAVNPGATIRLGDSTVTGNGTGLAVTNGFIVSYGTNKVDGNGTNGDEAITPADMK